VFALNFLIAIIPEKMFIKTLLMLIKKRRIFVAILVSVFLLGGVGGAFLFFSKEPFLETRRDEDIEIEKEGLPDIVIKNAEEFIISRVGADFFNNYISLDREKSRHQQEDTFCINNPDSCSEYLQKPHYLVFYLFEIPEKPFISEIIEIALFETGEIIEEREEKLPDCVESPTKCKFPIDEEEALSIAEKEGLKRGAREWETSFHWYAGDIKNYVWTVSNTLRDSRTFRSGENIVINANTGELIEISEWEQYIY